MVQLWAENAQLKSQFAEQRKQITQLKGTGEDLRAEVLRNTTAKRVSSVTMPKGSYLRELDFRGELRAMEARILQRVADCVGVVLGGVMPGAMRRSSARTALEGVQRVRTAIGCGGGAAPPERTLTFAEATGRSIAPKKTKGEGKWDLHYDNLNPRELDTEEDAEAGRAAVKRQPRHRGRGKAEKTTSGTSDRPTLDPDGSFVRKKKPPLPEREEERETTGG